MRKILAAVQCAAKGSTSTGLKDDRLVSIGDPANGSIADALKGSVDSPFFCASFFTRGSGADAMSQNG